MGHSNACQQTQTEAFYVFLPLLRDFGFLPVLGAPEVSESCECTRGTCDGAPCESDAVALDEEWAERWMGICSSLFSLSEEGCELKGDSVIGEPE